MLKKIWNILLSFQKTIMIISSVFVLLALFATVLLRYVFKTDLYGLEEIIVIPAMWMYFIGASYSTYERNHIAADLTNVYIKNPKILNIIKLITLTISLVVSAIFTYWSYGFIVWSIDSGATAISWKYPLYIPQGAILIGFILITFYLLVEVIEHFRMKILSR